MSSPGITAPVRVGDQSFLVPGRPLPQARRATADSAIARLQARAQEDGITVIYAHCQGAELGGHRVGLARGRARPRDADAPCTRSLGFSY